MNRREQVIPNLKATLDEDFENFILIGVKDGNIYAATTYPKWRGEAQYIIGQTGVMIQQALQGGWDIPDDQPTPTGNVVQFPKKH